MKKNNNWDLGDDDELEYPKKPASTTNTSARKTPPTESATRRVLRTEGATQQIPRTESPTRRTPRTEGATQQIPRTENPARRVPRTEGATQQIPRTENPTRRDPRTEGATQQIPRMEEPPQPTLRSKGGAGRLPRNDVGAQTPPQSKEYISNLQAGSITRNGSDDILAEIRHDLNQINPNEDLHFKKDDEKFKVQIKDNIRKIPNYVPVGGKDISGISVFAKVMFGIMIVAISLGLSITIIYCGSNVLGLGTPNADYVVEIDLNSNLEIVAETLESYGVIESALLFKTYVELTAGKGENEPVIQFGTYLLNSSMSYDEMLTELCQYSATAREVSVMFKEGITIYQMSKLLQENGVCNASDFINTIQEVDFGYDFLNNDTDDKFLFHNKEGYMFPDTYMFYIGDDPVNVGKKMVQNYNNRVTQMMEEALPNTNLNQHEIMTIASIVQLEAPDIDNMKKVASVYLNRLNNPGEYSQLQADPTKEYANELKLQMSIIDQEIIDAYNTYAGIGLPPGPVCNPGLDAIFAVLEPADTNYFYFCTNLTTGEFYFADNLEDHNKNVYNAGLRQ